MFHKLQSVLCVALAVSAAGALGGCVRERLTDCPPPVPEELQFNVNVVDAGTGESVPVHEAVTDGALFVFDSNHKMIHYQIVPKEDLGKEKTIPLGEATSRAIRAATRAPGDEIHIAAWGNVAQNMTTPDDFNLGVAISGTYLDMLSDPDHDDFMLPPGEMFFGLRTIDPTLPALADSAFEVQVSQINARLMVTARGIPVGASAGDYYYTLSRLGDGYTFDGTPVNDDRRHVRETGIFEPDGDFAPPEPWYLIPSVDPANVDADSALELHLMHVLPTRAGEEIDLTGPVRQDNEGNWIALRPGMTTNVLIDFTGHTSAGLVVRVEITPWNEVYQWIKH